MPYPPRLPSPWAAALQLGILFKGGEALERLAHLDAIVLDKTGTITVGRPTLAGVHSITPRLANDCCAFAAAAEEQSNHPLAHAVIDHARSLWITGSLRKTCRFFPAAAFQPRGRTGMPARQRDAFPRVLYPSAGPGARACSQASRACGWRSTTSPVGYFDARDVLRPDAAEAIAALRNGRIKAGMRVLMLTGDTAAAAAPIADRRESRKSRPAWTPQASWPAFASCNSSGLRVAMVGDGINDAAALAQADAGIAMGSGADLAQEAGDVLLLRAQPSASLQLSDSPAPHCASCARIWSGPRATTCWAFRWPPGCSYPAFHMLLTPWLAAAAMALSSVCVLGNSLRLRWWQLLPTRAW